MAALNELIQKIENPELRAQIQEAADRLTKQKKFGLVFEEHLPECTPMYDIPVRKGLKVSVRNGKANETYTVLKVAEGKAVCLPKNGSEAKEFNVADLVVTAELGDPIYPCLQPLGEVCNAPESGLWHTLIEADNYHALQLLEYLYAGKVDCIYIDPPYNTGAKDWKYNNDYVDDPDEYRHSKWLSFMQKRLEIAKRLLNPSDSVLIVTIDEKEYLHLGCLLEEMFPSANIQMITSVISPGGRGKKKGTDFTNTEEFLFYVRMGNAVVYPEVRSKEKIPLDWRGLIRGTLANGRGKHGIGACGPNQFYPIYVNNSTHRIQEIGDPIPEHVSRFSVAQIPGCVAVFPVRPDGTEMNWGCVPEEARNKLKKGCLRVNGYYPQKPQQYGIQYLTSGSIKDIESGKVVIEGYREDGSIMGYYPSGKPMLPSTVWNIPTHNATKNGTELIKSIFLDSRFDYPKSLYAVHDSIKHVLLGKKDAIIVDFFAGSGTTLHAINLLNAEDGGNRRCIMVTNNEISSEERKGFEARGIIQGDYEWDSRGIARYVTWPRTVCSIEGHDIKGNPLRGNYIGSEIPLAEGFKANAAFFKLGFLDKTKVSLGMQFKELLSTLWMKAGAIGRCPTIDATVPDMLILPENKMAVLTDENCFGEFSERLSLHPGIEVVYLVTDYESSFVAMTQALEGKQTYQLYRDYLDNFRINAGRNSR